MIAVTIGVGQKYEAVAELAAQSCHSRTGLETHILNHKHVEKYDVESPLLLKFKLLQEFPNESRIMYFDSDMIFLRKVDIEAEFCEREEFICVTDRYSQPFIQEDARRIGIPANEYFNAGWFILDSERHGPFLDLAEKLFANFRMPFLEQSTLNWARKLLAVPTHYASRDYNEVDFMSREPLPNTRIGHFISGNINGIPLNLLAEVFAKLGGVSRH